MKTVLEILQLSSAHLLQRNIESPRRQAEELISDALGIKRLELYLQFDRPLSQTELDLCRTRLTRRAKGEPAQYIHGEVDFYHCTFNVTPACLIPRQETEILADKIAQHLAKIENLAEKTLWDVCCGSGCLGISLKKKFPQLNVILSDISEDALQLAQKNAARNEVDVTFLHGDLLQPFHNTQADFVVCNPPYISEQEYTQLLPEVRDFEPRMALVGGLTGLEFYERLARELSQKMKPHGKIWFEIGKDQGKALNELFQGAPWKESCVEKDWAGHDRFFFLEIE